MAKKDDGWTVRLPEFIAGDDNERTVKELPRTALEYAAGFIVIIVAILAAVFGTNRGLAAAGQEDTQVGEGLY